VTVGHRVRWRGKMTQPTVALLDYRRLRDDPSALIRAGKLGCSPFRRHPLGLRMRAIRRSLAESSSCPVGLIRAGDLLLANANSSLTAVNHDEESSRNDEEPEKRGSPRERAAPDRAPYVFAESRCCFTPTPPRARILKS